VYYKSRIPKKILLLFSIIAISGTLPKKKKRERCIISGLIWWSAAGARPPRAIKRTP